MSGSQKGFVSPFRLAYDYKRSLGPLLTRFATGLRAGRLLGSQTQEGRVLFPAREYDPETGRDVLDALVEVGPGGTIETVTDGWALVRVDGADTAMLHRCAEGLRRGDRVLPRWRSTRTGSVEDIEAWVPEAEAPEQPHSDADATAEPVTRFKAPTQLDYVVTAGQITQQFLEGILERKLVGRRCPACERVYIPPRGSCPTCAEACPEAVELAQVGTVTTFSVIRIPFEGQMLTPPYACAHVVLDGADVPLLHIVGDCDPDDVRIGMRVRAVWADELQPTLASVRYFQPTGEPDADPAAYAEFL